ncbi:hypothetical protein BKA60DRAFT_64804 [Fusarium oxysporum]|nr:hypothetical protein BKA60DRAFT_64804 [Fusarium oxysporum]
MAKLGDLFWQLYLVTDSAAISSRLVLLNRSMSGIGDVACCAVKKQRRTRDGQHHAHLRCDTSELCISGRCSNRTWQGLEVWRSAIENPHKRRAVGRYAIGCRWLSEFYSIVLADRGGPTRSLTLSCQDLRA